jgi:undecaprenyl diphosphate synthase
MEKEALSPQIDEKRLPAHIAVIMDGNGRWAKKRNLPRVSGHKAGLESVEEIVKNCAQIGIQALTLYAFSIENWSRPKKEVDALMDLLCRGLDSKKKILNKNNVRLMISGEKDRVPKKVLGKLEKTQEDLSQNTGLILNLAFNYGSRQEIVTAVKNMLNDNVKDINEDVISKYLYTKNLPDPDLIIRTSGELRLSNFLLWQVAYSELHFTDVLWPDFKKEDLLKAIADYQSRDRRYGGL